MTASYDGRLAAVKTDILACCRPMDICAMRRQIYVSTKGQLILRSSEDPKKGMPMMCCPFCGARFEGGAQ